MITNRLSLETSPYLLQHQHNPVDWYPWGAEAFERARREDKPIFLSVGYSTCYWCHVMERQSFEVKAIAAEMNQRFINIKVDREERPDVDQLYMTAVQILARQGGWPMSVFLTPDLRPFYGGTYFPPTDGHGRPGFVTLLRAIEDAYRNRRPEVEKTATQLVGILSRLAEPAAPEAPIAVDLAWIGSLIDRSLDDYDPNHGGFGGAPKFPRETLLELLLVYLDPSQANGKAVTGERAARLRRMVLHTLDALEAGGIRDHLGGGFHRYSTDAQWLVPHFEIMLYDNAMLAWCYAEAFRQTREPRYAEVARGVLDFVLREMTSPDGTFYTAFDAEVDAMEGASYLWTTEQIDAVLGGDAAIFKSAYGVDRGPNFADPHHGNGVADQNILYLPESLLAVAARLGMAPIDLESKLATMRGTLLTTRADRKQPQLDTKILASWNALMIRAMAHAGIVLEEPQYLSVAQAAADSLLRQLRTPDGGLLHSVGRDTPGFLDDYAFLGQALHSLHNAGVAGTWDAQARELAEQIIRRFGDAEAGGFYFTDQFSTDLIVRQKTATDSPLPSGNAVAAMNLLHLGDVDRARDVIAAFAQQTSDHGEGMSSMVQAGLQYLRRAETFTVTAASDASMTDRPLSPQGMAEEVVSVSARWERDDQLRVSLGIRRGFHINAHDVPNGSLPLIATSLRVVDDESTTSIDYPAGEVRRFPFADQPLRVYTGEVTISVRFNSPRRGTDMLRVALTYQACDDTACLPPVTKTVPVEA